MRGPGSKPGQQTVYLFPKYCHSNLHISMRGWLFLQYPFPIKKYYICCKDFYSIALSCITNVVRSKKKTFWNHVWPVHPMDIVLSAMCLFSFFGSVLYCTALHCIALHCTALHCGYKFTPEEWGSVLVIMTYLLQTSSFQPRFQLHFVKTFSSFYYDCQDLRQYSYRSAEFA